MIYAQQYHSIPQVSHKIGKVEVGFFSIAGFFLKILDVFNKTSFKISFLLY